MRRDDSVLVAAMLMLILFALLACSHPTTTNKTEPTRRETQKEEHVSSDALVEEEPENAQQEGQVTPETVVEETPIPTEQEQNSKIEPETQELSPEEIWKQEMDYVVGYIHGQMKYISYITIKNKYEFNPDDIPENTYQEYIKAAEQLLNEAMENPEISDESIERYNVAVADIYDEEYLRFDRESIMSIQGFQEGVIYHSYMEAVKELLYRSGEMTEEQYQAWFEEMLYGENDLTHETVMERIEYSQKLLAQYGKENIPIPYFN